MLKKIFKWWTCPKCNKQINTPDPSVDKCPNCGFDKYY